MALRYINPETNPQLWAETEVDAGITQLPTQDLRRGNGSQRTFVGCCRRASSCPKIGPRRMIFATALYNKHFRQLNEP